MAAPVAFTADELQAMEQYQHVYSTINTWPTKKWYVGKGVKLRDLLNLAGIKADAQLINFTSSDGYTVTLMVKELLKDKRYYFPRLKDNNANDGSIPGSAKDAEEVEPILALLSTEDSNNPDDMTDMDALLLICGQRAVTEQTNSIFLKYISKIEVLTTAPQKWDNPQASVSSGEVSPGTIMELSNKRNDTDKIYYTTDGSTPTINSPIFNWSSKRWWSQRPDSLKNINKPLDIKNGLIIKAITIGPGRADSDVVTFSYQIGTANNTTNRVNVPGGPPDKIILDQDEINLKVGGSFELAATVSPPNAIDKSVNWSSSDTRVATVDNHGLVTVVGPGSAVITVKTAAGGLTAKCTVTGTAQEMDGKAEPLSPALNNNEQDTSAEPQRPETVQQQPVNKETTASDLTGAEKASQTPAQPKTPEANWQHLASKEEAAAGSTGPAFSSSQTDRQPGQVFEMSIEAAPLQLPEEQNSLNTYITIVFLILFLTGAGKRYTEYTKEATR